MKNKKQALIIGGSSGMGLATASKLAKEGFDITIVHRDRRSVLAPFYEKVEQLKSLGEEVSTYNIDGTSPEKINAFIEEIKTKGSFDLVLHAISRGNLKPFVSEGNQPELNASDLSLTLDAMSTNVHTWVQALIKADLIAKGARIVTLTSAGSEKYWPGYGAVAMAKASLEILTKYLAVELAQFDLRVNCINAGITDTPSLRFIPGHETLIEGANARNPLGRITKAEDVADAIYLLTLPEANWMNGNVIHVDGGEHLMG